MCGIIGYVGEREAVPILINGLKKLEYRGYDSAGICIKKDAQLKILKTKGRIFELEEKQKIEKLSGNIGIAHTRWATHGNPDETNAHPHFDCMKQISIAHNGIIENFNSLKNILQEEGHKIISDTDSEIIAHLIEKFYADNLEEAVSKALKLIEGTFGLAIISDKKDKIIAARKG